MEETKFRSSMRTVSVQLGIEGIVDGDYQQSLYDDSDGHPYVAKILLGETARTQRPASVERVMATREDILDGSI